MCDGASSWVTGAAASYPGLTITQCWFMFRKRKCLTFS